MHRNSNIKKTVCLIGAHCGDNTCSLAGQVRHNCITPFPTTPAGQATETVNSPVASTSAGHITGHLSIIQWPSHLEAKLKNTYVSSSGSQFRQPCGSHRGHQSCRPRATDTCVSSSDHRTCRPVPSAGPTHVLRLCASCSAPGPCIHTWKHNSQAYLRI